MSRDPEQLLERLASRGHTRGSVAVLEAAQRMEPGIHDLSASRDQSTSPRTGRLLVGAGVALLAAVVITAAVLSQLGDRSRTSVTADQPSAIDAERTHALGELDQAYSLATSGDPQAVCSISSLPDVCRTLIHTGLIKAAPAEMPTVVDGHRVEPVDAAGLSFPGGYLLRVCGALPDGSIYVSDFVVLDGGSGTLNELYWTDGRLNDPVGTGTGTAIPSPAEIAECHL